MTRKLVIYLNEFGEWYHCYCDGAEIGPFASIAEALADAVKDADAMEYRDEDEYLA